MAVRGRWPRMLASTLGGTLRARPLAIAAARDSTEEDDVVPRDDGEEAVEDMAEDTAAAAAATIAAAAGFVCSWSDAKASSLWTSRGLADGGKWTSGAEEAAESGMDASRRPTNGGGGICKMGTPESRPAPTAAAAAAAETLVAAAAAAAAAAVCCCLDRTNPPAGGGSERALRWRRFLGFFPRPVDARPPRPLPRRAPPPRGTDDPGLKVYSPGRPGCIGWGGGGGMDDDDDDAGVEDAGENPFDLATAVGRSTISSSSSVFGSRGDSIGDRGCPLAPFVDTRKLMELAMSCSSMMSQSSSESPKSMSVSKLGRRRTAPGSDWMRLWPRFFL
mmetsp:Transcript_27015/g.78636  ORF Transcript_27015/g.78636 Transcript_27015/m.78636 type:complete len:333 (-) Transcript_27015:219-1217(-)